MKTVKTTMPTMSEEARLMRCADAIWDLGWIDDMNPADDMYDPAELLIQEIMAAPDDMFMEL